MASLQVKRKVEIKVEVGVYRRCVREERTGKHQVVFIKSNLDFSDIFLIRKMKMKSL